MTENKRRFKVEIDGQTYTIIGKSSPEHMQAVIKLVEEQLGALKEMMPSLTKEKAAVLLAINAVSDQLKKQAELEELKTYLASLEKLNNEEVSD
ncbi:cell division protein ZapA [Ligilactobacillus equi]|uniref:Cell division protein ZapA n=2 Tax=Ligilactobacillus equi TaxID=137357 RepID=V7HYI9_9LACO|nr:cell division protein ZapA [Ligilactobacillus equi]ETA74932.1 stimulator of FtsZ polymerization and component of cell-division Z-ring [Ligilactobacillus equi DPC 6820]KRL85303.1 hypothetical protein FC36_GL000675 [Ligilactobacillus equi DSM 15833 = JCM 10991]MCQ2556419.1 cell division protein ZapA [Ligilactobacillus sp.]